MTTEELDVINDDESRNIIGSDRSERSEDDATESVEDIAADDVGQKPTNTNSKSSSRIYWYLNFSRPNVDQIENRKVLDQTIQNRRH